MERKLGILHLMIAANLAAATVPGGEIFNIGGSSRVVLASSRHDGKSRWLPHHGNHIEIAMGRYPSYSGRCV